MRWLVLSVMLVAIGCGDPTITDPCPGQLTCPDEVCCPLNFPYHCGTQCNQAPCGPTQLTCVFADRTDGCYGGTWNGTFSGTYTPPGGGMQTIGGNLVFEITSHAITSTQPAQGSGSVDCKSGVGTLTLSSGGGQPLVFNGTWMHTSDMGDKILSPTISASSGSANGTWSALRIY